MSLPCLFRFTGSTLSGQLIERVLQAMYVGMVGRFTSIFLEGSHVIDVSDLKGPPNLR